MIVDLSGATLFGNLNKGGGLPAVFDALQSTAAWVEGGVGWAGASLPSPKPISRASFTSFGNGFDSSGSTGGVKLELRGKNGSPPVGCDDGVLLGQSPFIDKNQVRTMFVESTDKVSEFEHVWGVVRSGIWSTLTGMKLYEVDRVTQDPEPLGAGSHVLLSSCNENIPLTKAGVELHPVRTRIVLLEPRNVLLDFHGDVIHVGIDGDHSIAVGWSFWIAARSADAATGLGQTPFVNISNAVGGGNVSERNPQHYGNKTIPTAAGQKQGKNQPVVKLPAGVHEFTVFGNCHTDGNKQPDDSTTEGLIEVLSEYGTGLNCLRVTVLS